MACFVIIYSVNCFGLNFGVEVVNIQHIFYPDYDTGKLEKGIEADSWGGFDHKDKIDIYVTLKNLKSRKPLSQPKQCYLRKRQEYREIDRMDDLVINDGLDEMDFNKVTEMLSRAFWCFGTKIDEVKKGAQNSALVVGAFIKDIGQVGYARVISDKTRFAYILDVYVDESYRKKGIGQRIINYILSHDELKDVYQWLLITSNAHGVYSKLGFKPVSRPLDWMEIRNERPER